MQEVSVERDLGVYIDSSLQSSKQCVEAAKRGNRILGMIKRNFSFCKQDPTLLLGFTSSWLGLICCSASLEPIFF